MNGVEVVVTGMGVVSAFGVGRERLWSNLSRGVSGIRWISAFDAANWPVRFAGEVPDFDAERFLKRHTGLRRDRGLQFGLVAAAEALREAGLLNENDEIVSHRPVAAVVGSGLGPCFEAEFAYGCFFEKGPQAVRPTTVPKSMFNSLSSNLSIYFGLRGSNFVVASACASGASAIGHALMAIKSGMEDIVVCGGADSPLAPSMFSAWTNMKVMARHEEPSRAARPFDRCRTGLVLAEGAAMVVLESRESAESRGAPILARISGYGSSSDAHHITAPLQAGQELAMRRCLASAGVKPEEVDYINAHGTGTVSNDSAEAAAIQSVFGARGAKLPVSSTKSMLGHALGASGAIEFVACVDSIRHEFVPPTINCDEPDPELGLDYVPHAGRRHAIQHALSNSFAFGGNNCALLVSKICA